MALDGKENNIIDLITNTYQHISGIGPKKEALLWEEGLTDWQSALKNINYYAMPNSIREALKYELPKSIYNLNSKNYDYFLKKFPNQILYRLYPMFMDKTVFLDIETTGMKPAKSYVTVIGCYDGKDMQVFVHGKNERDFLDYIKNYSIIVTFNGSCFDIPFLERYFNTKIKCAQIDLRFVLKDLGYTGGLKKIEKDVGIDRGDDMLGVNGYTAVLLWNYYLDTKDETAIDSLIHYNLLDTIDLEYLLCLAYNKYAEKYKTSLLDYKELPSVSKYKPNKKLIDYLHKHPHKYSPKNDD